MTWLTASANPTLQCQAYYSLPDNAVRVVYLETQSSMQYAINPRES